MKKIKILTAILAVCITAAFSVSAKEDISAADSFLAALGVTDESFEEKAEISRGEFIELIARALKINCTEVSVAPFSDVPAEHPCAPYASMLKTMNIINGSGGNFMPERAVTLEEASYMAVRAMGYASVLSYGEGPAMNYTSVINSLGITKDIAKKSSDTITSAEAKIIIYKMMLGDIMVTEGIENSSAYYKSRRGRSILTEYWKLSEVCGILTANEYTHITNADVVLGDGYVSIDNVMYDDAGGYAKGLLGKRVLAYVDEDGKIVFANGYKNAELEITDCKDAGYENGKIKYYENEKQNTADLSSSFAIVKNGRTADFSNDLVKNADYISLLDNDSDGAYDVVFVEQWQYGIYGGANTFAEIIYDSRNHDLMYNYSNEDGRHVIIYKKNGNGVFEQCDTDYLESGDAMRYIVSDDKLYLEIYASNSSISGKYTAKDDDYIYIDGAPYIMSDYAKAYYSNISIGSDYTFMLTDNDVVAAAFSGSGGLVFGYLMDADGGSGVSSEISVKLLTASGDIKIFALAEKVYLDAELLSSTSGKVKEAVMNSDGTKKYGLIRYAVNKDGEISAIDTLKYTIIPKPYEEPEEDKDALYCNFDYIGSGKKKLIFKSENSYFYTGTDIKGRVGSGTVIFRVPDVSSGGAFDDKDFAAGAVFSNDTSYMIDIYNVDEIGMAGCIVYYSTAGSAFDAAVNNYKNYSFGVVDYVVNAINEEGEAVKKVYFWSNGGFKSLMTEPDAYNHSNAAGEDDGNMLSPGDIFTYSTNNSGYIDMYRIYYDFSEKKEIYTVKDAAYLVNVGKVSNRRGSDAMFVSENNPDSRIPVTMPSNYAVVNRNGHVVPASAGDIMTVKNVGEELASRVFLWARYTRGSFAVIYEE